MHYFNIQLTVSTYLHTYTVHYTLSLTQCPSICSTAVTSLLQWDFISGLYCTGTSWPGRLSSRLVPARLRHTLLHCVLSVPARRGRNAREAKSENGKFMFKIQRQYIWRATKGYAQFLQRMYNNNPGINLFWINKKCLIFKVTVALIWVCILHKAGEANTSLKTASCEAGSGTTLIHSMEICVWSLLFQEFDDGCCFPNPICDSPKRHLYKEYMKLLNTPYRELNHCPWSNWP